MQDFFHCIMGPFSLAKIRHLRCSCATMVHAFFLHKKPSIRNRSYDQIMLRKFSTTSNRQRQIKKLWQRYSDDATPNYFKQKSNKKINIKIINPNPEVERPKCVENTLELQIREKLRNFLNHKPAQVSYK